MGYQPYLPTAVAWVNVLCIPVGPITPERFQTFVAQLQRAAAAKLSHEPAATKPAESGDSVVLYDISAAQDSGRPQLFPFETNGRCQVLLGLVDHERVHASGRLTDESLVGGLDGGPTLLDSLRGEFAQLYAAADVILVRRLVVCGASTDPPPTSTSESASTTADCLVLLSDIDDPGDSPSAHHALANISKQFREAVAPAIEDFKDQPISMVPGTGTDLGRRAGNIPGPRRENAGTVSAGSPGPAIAPNGAESQSETSRGRFHVVKGMLLLQAGQWADALAALSDGASITQSGHDHLWHAKALEGLLVAMVLLTWSGATFAVPAACRSLPNRVGVVHADTSQTLDQVLKALARLMPPLVETILELYAKVSNLDLGGPLQDILRETRVRQVNTLIVVKQSGGVLHRRCLAQLVRGRLGAPDPPPRSSGEGESPAPPSQGPREGEAVAASKAGLAQILIETLQTAQTSSNAAHHTAILIAVATSLSALGLDRKSTFYLKQLMQHLVPRLIEARKVGASEAGVHPAAGLPPIGGLAWGPGAPSEAIQGMRSLLALGAGAYGVSLPVDTPDPPARVSADADQVGRQVAVWTAEQTSGEMSLKLEMLRTCLSVCDALPDVAAGLHLTSSLLRAAKSALTVPGAPAAPPVPLIATDEQVRLMENLKRMVSAAPRLGADGYRGEYWDDFLVRDVRVWERGPFSNLVAHQSRDLAPHRSSGRADGRRDPFIYNPFAKDDALAAAPVLVAGELASFTVVLQNPLAVEVELDTISLTTTGGDFAAAQHSIVLGPLSIQPFTLTGTPAAAGDLQVVGCTVGVRSCYEQDFLIYRDDWRLPFAPKQKALGRRVPMAATKSASQQASNVAGGLVEQGFRPPVPSTLQLQVISRQPRLAVRSSSLDQAAVMLLEGERRDFDLSFVNESAVESADFVMATTHDSVTRGLQAALSDKELSPVDLYEIQHQLAHRPVVTVDARAGCTDGQPLKPGEVLAYRAAVIGRPGLVHAAVQVDYAYLAAVPSDIQGTLYTRRIVFPFTVTVNGSVEIPRCNILPVHGDFGWTSRRTLGAPRAHDLPSSQHRNRSTAGSTLADQLTQQADASDCCMLSLDLRNVWPRPLHVTIQTTRSSDDACPADQASSADAAYSVHETLQPGVVTRVVLLVPRLFVADPHAPIPNLDTQKQFVVTTSKLSAEAELASRESFWYREELLKHLTATWREDDSGRQGSIDLRKYIRLTARMVDVINIDHVEIDYAVRLCEGEPRDHDGRPDGEDDLEGPVDQVGRSHFVMPVERFATLSVTIHNRSPDELRLLLRLQPSLRHQPHAVALDLSKRLAWSGVLQRALHPAIAPGGQCVAELGVIALAAGDYEINASVEEIQGRAGVAADPGRRIWHARSPCLIDAVGR